MKQLLTVLSLLCIGVLATAQTTDDYLKQTLQYADDVSEGITDGAYFQNNLRINTNKKNWADLTNYSEDVNYYYEMNEAGIMLRKILVTVTEGNKKAFKNYIFNDKGEVMLCYVDYVVNDEKLPQQSTFFINQELLAFSNSEEMVLGEDLTDDMVSVASAMYLDAIKYRKFFQGMMIIQLAN